MDRFDTLRIFVAVAQAQGFAAGARQLGLSAPVATRAVAALEAHLGTRLLQRSTRQIRLTETGARYLADSLRILDQLGEADAQARGAHVRPQGHLVLTAPVLFGRLHMAPLLMDFLALYPEVSAQALFVDRVTHLLEEGIDVALRIAHLPDSGLTAVRVGAVRRVIVAAPEYLAAHGTPRTPADLALHEAVNVSITGDPAPAWQLAQTPGQPEGLAPCPQPRMRLTVNGMEVAIQAAEAGRGLSQALSYQVAQAVAAGRLQVLLTAYEPAPIPVHLVHVEGRRATAKVRAFLDYASAQLRAHRALDPLRVFQP